MQYSEIDYSEPSVLVYFILHWVGIHFVGFTEMVEF